MGRLLKILLYIVGAVVAIVLIAAISFMLLFDPNDYREQIAEETRRATGRELLIEGDLDVSLFPWLAIGVGKTTLGNAPGFGDEPFASFDHARLSVRLLPMLLRRELSVGTAELESLRVNLAVASDGRSNWQDLLEAGEAETEPADTGERETATLDIAGIDISNASLTYRDAQTGDRYSLSEINLKSGRVAAGEAVPLTGDMNFDLQPADISGDARFKTTVTFDTEQQLVTFGETGLSVLGVDIFADIEPLAYAESTDLVGTIQVDAFSLRSLMERMDIETPQTVDPNALGKVILDANARIAADRIALTDVELVIDDTTMRGDMSVMLDESGRIGFEFEADRIELDRYMEPAAEAAGGATDEVPVEIPVDLIQTLNLGGSLTIDAAELTGMRFENIDVKVNAADGVLRLHPMSANLFDGTYRGDVRIDASGATPALSVNETVTGVDLGSLARAMFDAEQVTGKINGSFQLAGRGEDLAAMQQSLNGKMEFALVDGAYEGTDLWHEIRRARALFKKEPAPEPVLPARTQFSNVQASGLVTDGVFRNDDLLAELPFMQLTGNGSVDLAKAEIDYRLRARVLEKPEFATGATPEELEEFTEAVIPLRISGSLADPSIKPDIEDMLKQRVKEEVEDKLKDALQDIFKR